MNNDETIKHGDIFKKIASIMDEINAIGKDSTNAKQGFKYRSIDAIYNALHPLYAKHHVFNITEVLDEKTETKTSQSGTSLIYRILKVKFTLFAEDGSFVSSILIGEAMDSGDKAANKAMTNAHKYFLTQTFMLQTEDLDPDGDTPPVLKSNGLNNKPNLLPTYVNNVQVNTTTETNNNNPSPAQKGLLSKLIIQVNQKELSDIMSKLNLAEVTDLDKKEMGMLINELSNYIKNKK